MPRRKKLTEPLIDKQVFKKIAGKCQICPEDRYELLDVHRIIPGADDGKYTRSNSVCLCSNCHRLVHHGWYTIIGWRNSTAGRVLMVKVGSGDEHDVEKFF
jgi:5-methylcytosine-specific restriction endonuclease McrA